MKKVIYQVDAFSDVPFGGNPAGVVLNAEGLNDTQMLRLAKEMNLSETAFVIRKSLGHYDLKWFTPKSEIDLCGHATLATAFVVSNFVDVGLEVMEFSTLSGILKVIRNEDEYIMNFPAILPKSIDIPLDLEGALRGVPIATWLDRDLVVLVKDASVVSSLEPDILKLCLL